MVALIVQVIIALVVAGFVVWAGRKILGACSSFIDPMFVTIIDVLIVILAAAIIIFYAILPVLHAVAGLNLNIH